jgi:SAM-dependent methyltransferase
MQGDNDQQLVAALFSRFADRIQVDADGYLTMEGADWDPVTISRLLRDLWPDANPADAMDAYRQLVARIIALSPDQYRAAGFVIPPPAKGYHYSPVDGLFYDFVNTDRVLSELLRAGARMEGAILDFGCSTGRSAAAIERAHFPNLLVHGCDPVPSSIEWAKANVPGVQFALSQQDPPLPYSDETFNLVFARSIWTHFSLRAARIWLSEIERIMTPDGYFFFNFHGPHDLANRIIFNIPSPHYPGIANGEFTGKTAFIGAMIKGLRNEGFIFRPYSDAASQADLGKLKGAEIADWGVAFMTLEFLTEQLLPDGLEVVRYTPAATAGRLDGVVVRKSASKELLSTNAL